MKIGRCGELKSGVCLKGFENTETERGVGGGEGGEEGGEKREKGGGRQSESKASTAKKTLYQSTNQVKNVWEVTI